MARKGRPPFKPTAGQKDRVTRLRADGWSQERIARIIGIDVETLLKHFVEELEHGADIKRDKLLEYAEKAAKRGNASLIKWLSDRQDAARAAQQLEQRARTPETEEQPPAETRPPKLGKKEQQQQAAGEVTGKFAPPPGPSKAVH